MQGTTKILLEIHLCYNYMLTFQRTNRLTLSAESKVAPLIISNYGNLISKDI